MVDAQCQIFHVHDLVFRSKQDITTTTYQFDMVYIVGQPEYKPENLEYHWQARNTHIETAYKLDQIYF